MQEFSGPGSGDAPERDETLFEYASLSEAERLVVSLDGYEGPIDMLLDMAKGQKVDLWKISVLALAEQYLEFINAAKRLRIELAADYLVMAAWLAYLKSKLLLPKAPKEEDGEEEDEEVKLMRRLMRREAMNQLTAQAEKLFEGDLLGRDVFVRGEPERRAVDVRVEYTASMLDLLRAYAKTATKRNFQPLHLERRRAVVAIDEALLALRRALEEKGEWDILERYLPERWRNEDYARSAVASTFSAALELCKHGRAVLRQDAPFEPIHLRMRTEEEREALMRAAEQRVDGPSLSEALGRLNEKGHAA